MLGIREAPSRYGYCTAQMITVIILEKEIETQDDFTSKVENNPQ